MNNYKRKKDPTENRKLILDAAMQLSSEIGLESLTLDGVAKKANLSKGGLLHHFPKKEALIEELFTSSLQDLLTALHKEEKQGISPAMAYLKLAIDDDPDDQRKVSMRLLFQAIIQNSSYRDRLQEWYTQHVIYADTTPMELGAILTADGIWYSNVFGAFTLTEEQKQQVANIFSKNR